MIPSLGISLIAFNEERQIESALQSALFADDVVLVDCESSDRTVEIARRFEKVRVFSRPNNPNLNVNKSFGIAQLSTDWIFYLDPDEIIPPSLTDEIGRVIGYTDNSAFKLPRRNFFFGRWLQRGGQYPDYQLRLFRRGKASFPERHVHESLQITGSTGYLSEPFDHHPYPEIDDYIRKMNFYTSFQADFWRREKMSQGIFRTMQYMFFRPFNRFIRRYIFKAGFMDGWQGYLAACGDAFQTAAGYGKYLRHPERPER